MSARVVRVLSVVVLWGLTSCAVGREAARGRAAPGRTRVAAPRPGRPALAGWEAELGVRLQRSGLGGGTRAAAGLVRHEFPSALRSEATAYAVRTCTRGADAFQF